MAGNFGEISCQIIKLPHREIYDDSRPCGSLIYYLDYSVNFDTSDCSCVAISARFSEACDISLIA